MQTQILELAVVVLNKLVLDILDTQLDLVEETEQLLQLQHHL
jgi:hypothetical protein